MPFFAKYMEPNVLTPAQTKSWLRVHANANPKGVVQDTAAVMPQYTAEEIVQYMVRCSMSLRNGGEACQLCDYGLSDGLFRCNR